MNDKAKDLFIMCRFTSLSTLYRSYLDRWLEGQNKTSTYSLSGFCTVNC